MNIECIVKVTFSLALAGVMLGAGGCATSGYQKGAKTASALQTSAERIERAAPNLDRVVTSINELVSNPQPDLRPQFRRFSTAVGDLESLGKRISQADANVQARGAAYFANWDHELAGIQSEDIRALSQARKSEVAAQFDRVQASCQGVGGAFNSFMSDVRDVQKFLSADLTSGGLVAIKDAAARVNQDFLPLRESVNNLAAELRTLGLATSPKTGAVGAVQ